jgi:DNA processing protein
MVLNAIEGWGPISGAKALEWSAGDIEKLFQSPTSELSKVVGLSRAKSLDNWEKQFNLPREKDRLQDIGGRFVIPEDAEYPERLKALPDSPLGLYCKGRSMSLKAAIAIVGTRRSSAYGKKVTEQFVQALVQAGFTIVSGMALGIDAIAHEATLRAEGRTIAVFGNGLDIVYPNQNRRLYEEIGDSGLLMSEFSLGRRPDRQSFPQRNRIVSGMTAATLVVESASKGGSLITARFAMEQNRTVFAVPGRLDQPQSRGCLELIRDGASLVTSVEDIIEELRFMQLDLDFCKGTTKTQSIPEGAVREMGEDERKVFQSLPPGETWHTDEICDASSMPGHRVQAALMMLELQGFVSRSDGGRYERKI